MKKKPRLFYYEEGVDAWCPAPGKVTEIIDTDSHFSGPDEIVEIRFKRIDMTDHEFDTMPEV